MKKAKPQSKNGKMVQELFPIVGIGASAGGLEAFMQLLKTLPINTGMGFVFISHLDPTRKSQITEILARATTMPLQEVKTGMKIQPNHIYIIPPNANMTISSGVLKLEPRTETRGAQMAIDRFFLSLAQDQGRRAIGIILSGAAGDGAQGIKAIKSAGGVTFAQQEKNAKYSSMPQHAIATGSVDFVLTTYEIAKELTRISKHPYLNNVKTRQPTLRTPDQKNSFPKIFYLLRKFNSVDFTNYKHATIKRRIERRMLLNNIDWLGEYSLYLKDNPEELEALFDDLLINVTSFFREPEKFEALKTIVFPAIMKNRAGHTPIRIWAAGCSTGEEAYTIAICLLEFLGSNAAAIPIQVFATDLSKKAIEKARGGIYSQNITADVNPERLERFFQKIGGRYQLNKQVRDMCIFSEHNLAIDPPFSRLDIISCCNVLIYMEPVLQQKIISSFYYALNPNGHLMLGNSENIGNFNGLFLPTDKKNKLYTKKVDATNPNTYVNFNKENPYTTNGAGIVSDNGNLNNTKQSRQNEVDNILLTRYVPASVLLDENMEILEFRGPTSSYLEHRPGHASLNLLKMGPENLLLEIRALIYKVKKEKKAAKKENISIKINGKPRTIKLEVIQLKTSYKPYFLTLFEEHIPTEISRILSSRKKLKSKKHQDEKDIEITSLRLELENTKSYLQSIIKEQDRVNEELKSANEEILSSNEELQSINEEMETSKEELESANEELITVNDELQNRNEQIKKALDYAQAIVETVQEPLIILDSFFHVRSANSAFYKTFHVLQAETEGKFFYDLSDGQWNIPKLNRYLNNILSKRTPFKNFEVDHIFPKIGHKILRLNARQVVNLELILLTMEDITEQKLLEKQKEIIRQKDTFIAIASHELKTPVTSIKAFTQVLQNRFAKAGDEKSATLLMKMNVQLDKLTGLITDLLDVTKIESGKLQFHKEYFDFNELVDEIIVELQRTTQKHTISKKLANSKSIYGDRDRIGQVIVNLLNNAIKYSPHSKEIIVKTQTDRHKVALCVEDHGVGISKESQKKVFERFFRVAGKKEETFPGMGLGLFVSEEIIKRHKGRIWVEGEKGKGSTFCFTIPIGKKESV